LSRARKTARSLARQQRRWHQWKEEDLMLEALGVPPPPGHTQ
jgi:hypothetical protein